MRNRKDNNEAWKPGKAEMSNCSDTGQGLKD